MTLAFDSEGSWAVALLPLAKRPGTTGTIDLGRPFAVGLDTCPHSAEPMPGIRR